MTAGEAAFFRRFRFGDDDLAEVEAEIAADEATVAAADGDTPATAAALIRLGFNLTPLGREAAAATRLEAGIAMSQRLGEHAQEVSALLHLATARQYLGEREQAQQLFQAGLDQAARYGTADEVHYLLHHRGRCYAEQGRAEEARACLEQALALRLQLGQPRLVASSRTALTELAGSTGAQRT